MPNKPNYVLKAGVVIHPQGTNKFYANANIPDDVAETHLAKNPESINDFQSYPADYALRVEARKNGEAPAPDDIEGLANAYQQAVADKNAIAEELNAAKAELEAVKAELAEAQTKLESAGEDENGGTDDGALAIEIETLKADLEAANAENEALKKEIETLKASANKKKTTAKAAE